MLNLNPTSTHRHRRSSSSDGLELGVGWSGDAMLRHDVSSRHLRIIDCSGVLPPFAFRNRSFKCEGWQHSGAMDNIMFIAKLAIRPSRHFHFRHFIANLPAIICFSFSPCAATILL